MQSDPYLVDRVEALCQQFSLPPGSATKIQALIRLLVAKDAPTSIHDPDRAVDVHIADALIALQVPALRAAGNICDIGSGAGIPGLVLAIALPTSHVVSIESVQRKCRFIARCAVEL